MQDQNTISDVLDHLIRRIGDATSWLCLALVALIVSSVMLRYVLSVSSLALDELQWHIYSLSWLIGFSYATVEGSHVRNDILYNKFSQIARLRIDLCSYLFLLLPFVGIAIYHSVFFVKWAYLQNEGSLDPGGLPYRWIIKTALPVGFALLGLSAISRIIDLSRQIASLKKARN